jgi:hypothetical protein
MNQLVESLYRLYNSNKIDKSQLNKLLTNKKINQQEYNYIISAKKAV